MRCCPNALSRLGVLVSLLLLGVSAATAQQPERSQRRGTAARSPVDPAVKPPRDTSPEHKFVIFKLEHNAAESVVSLLENFLPSVVKTDNLRLAADSRTNSILAAGTDDALQKIESMLRELDVAGEEPRAAAATEVKIFALQHVSAREAAETLRTLYGEQASSPFQRMRGGEVRQRLAIAADERANSVIVSGGKDLLDEIEALLVRLDQAQPGEEERQVEVIALRGIPANENEVVETLRRMGVTRLDVVADGTANQIILRGDRQSVQQATELLQKVYADRQQNDADVRLRVIWLVSPGLAGEDAADPPQNLEKVLNALENSAGVGDLKMAAQFVLNASGRSDDRSQQHFRATGTSTVQGATAEVRIEGQFEQSRGPHPRLQIQIDATRRTVEDSRRGDVGFRQLCQLQTTVSAPPGHPVVLGMTPIDSMNSVFVIELLPPDEPEPAATTPAAP